MLSPSVDIFRTARQPIPQFIRGPSVPIRGLFLFFCASYVASASSGPLLGDEPSAVSRPNVLLLVSEDNGPELGCYGDPYARTPHLDQLAAEGVRFENAFVTFSVCSPSRGTLFTGLYPHQNGQVGLATHKFAMYRKWAQPHQYSPGGGVPHGNHWQDSRQSGIGLPVRHARFSRLELRRPTDAKVRRRSRELHQRRRGTVSADGQLSGRAFSAASTATWAASRPVGGRRRAAARLGWCRLATAPQIHRQLLQLPGTHGCRCRHGFECARQSGQGRFHAGCLLGRPWSAIFAWGKRAPTRRACASRGSFERRANRGQATWRTNWSRPSTCCRPSWKLSGSPSPSSYRDGHSSLCLTARNQPGARICLLSGGGGGTKNLFSSDIGPRRALQTYSEPATNNRKQMCPCLSASVQCPLHCWHLGRGDRVGPAGSAGRLRALLKPARIRTVRPSAGPTRMAQPSGRSAFRAGAQRTDQCVGRLATAVPRPAGRRRPAATLHSRSGRQHWGSTTAATKISVGAIWIILPNTFGRNSICRNRAANMRNLLNTPHAPLVFGLHSRENNGVGVDRKERRDRWLEHPESAAALFRQ